MFQAGHLKNGFPRGHFGANDVYSVVHQERETEEAKPIAVAHTHACLWRRLALIPNSKH